MSQVMDRTPEVGTAVLSARGVTKEYGPVTALAGVDLDIRAGEVLALLGDNGAGKSTLVSILSGVRQPSSGQLLLDGEPVHLGSALRARELGIVTVFQDLALADAQDVAFNLFLGVEPRRFGFVLDRRRMYAEAERVLDELRVSVPSVRTQVRSLSGGQRQAVAIARTVARGSRVVMMDEPTAALGVRESRRVLDLIKELRASGHAVLMISHNIESVFEVADRALILRLGSRVAEVEIETATMEDVVGYVIGSRGPSA